ncbi:hypothetical protein [Streptomyces sp. NPDC007100]|uniref:hypothetical protein n=1 Tax=Streptomyces sp. NPDC007100 TaxID=3155602 RepID=UPI00340C9694
MRRTTRAIRTVRVPRALFPATALCLAALLTACGDAGGRGYAATGAAGPADGRTPAGPVPPEDGITLTPLDGDTTPGTPTPSARADKPPTRGPSEPTRTSPAPPTTPPNTRPKPPTHPSPNTPRPPGTTAPTPPTTPTPPTPPTPPHLTLGPLHRAEADTRWCEKVSADLRNTGDRPLTSGTITFGTHIIGPLGIDWSTRTTNHPLPTPLLGHSHRTATWHICLPAWRVPLGMHVETRDVDVDWR